MDSRDLEAILLWKLCPACILGMVREIDDKVFICDHSQCCL